MEPFEKKERIKDLKTITSRHVARDIEGCVSWRHYAVHQDRAWLLRAIEKIKGQVDLLRQAVNTPGDQVAVDRSINELLGMFEQDRLNHLGDEDS